MITVRGEIPDDVEGIHEITAAAFETDAEAELIDALRSDPAWIEGLSWVVCDGDIVVAHALLSRNHVGETPSLTLGPVAVRPELQRQGLGERVIRAALDAAREAGEPSVIVLGHPDYYPRFGFTRASDHGIGVDFEVPDDALMALSLNDDPLPRGTVCYPAPFGV